MRITGSIATRMADQFANFIGMKGTVYSVSSVIQPPIDYLGHEYNIAMVDLNDGTRKIFQVDSSSSVDIGDTVNVVLRFAYDTDQGLKFYIPKIVKYE